MDLSIFRTKLAATSQQLADAGREADVSGAPALTAALEQLGRAARGVDELMILVRGDATMGRTCPTCAKTVMTAATLCGFCWTRLTPVKL